MSAGSSTAIALIRAPAWLTTWAMSYRLSIRGLTISARCPAISARRRRRISSSLLPLNIGPQTTSSQPPARGCVLITRENLLAAADVALEHLRQTRRWAPGRRLPLAAVRPPEHRLHRAGLGAEPRGAI